MLPLSDASTASLGCYKDDESVKSAFCIKIPRVGRSQGNFSNIFVTKVKAPYIAHLSLLTSIGYNKKETNLKNCPQ